MGIRWVAHTVHGYRAYGFGDNGIDYQTLRYW